MFSSFTPSGIQLTPGGARGEETTLGENYDFI